MDTFMDKAKSFLIGALPIIGFFALWQLVTTTGIISSAIVPPPTKVFVSLYGSLESGQLLTLTAYSLINVLVGLLLAIVAGIAGGVLIGIYLKKLSASILPFLRICEKLNPFALFPIFVLIFGIGREEKVAIVFWVAVWPLLFSTIDGAHNLDRDILKSARSMGTGRWALLRKVIAPMMAPSIFTGMKSSAQLAFFMIIASELAASTTGLGWYFMQSSRMYNIGLMYGIILFITIIAIAVNILFTLIEKRVSLWRQDTFAN